jgi:hypothetical protein
MGQEVTMDTATEHQEPGTGVGGSDRERKDPRFVAAQAAGGGERGRELLEHAAQGAELNGDEEHAALDWLLGTPKPIMHEIPVDFETEKGMKKLTFLTRRIDPRKIDAIEIRNIQQSTGRVDRITADCEIIAESCDVLDDGRRKVNLNSDEFLTVRLRNRDTGEVEAVKLASPATALERRFVGQEGLLTLVSAEIRRLGGYDPQRLGTSQRRLVEASLG